MVHFTVCKLYLKKVDLKMINICKVLSTVSVAQEVFQKWQILKTLTTTIQTIRTIQTHGEVAEPLII